MIAARMAPHDLALTIEDRRVALPVGAAVADHAGSKWQPAVHGMAIDRLADMLEAAGHEEAREARPETTSILGVSLMPLWMLEPGRPLRCDGQPTPPQRA